jgi:CCR4-NOT transcriptional complex subunit CAF120
VGTVLSLWDAAELDAAGEDGEVLPKFLNLTDASVKMVQYRPVALAVHPDAVPHGNYIANSLQIESLPTKSNDEQPLQNILSISTAGRNRYLLHFNSHHSLIQWTSAIRLAIFEHSTLQEAYTGALVAGKGKTLNSINIIMERARQPISEWVRVRFGAGVPWKRCFCVIEPPSEKEYQKAQKEWKKRNPYDRSHGPVVKGEIKFFDSRKEAEKKKKHQHPIATITDAYAAYAIYPQAKELIDSSTLIKIEGDITIHTEPSSSSEGFVFIMPETHPAVSGFEMMLRFLFPTWDTFALYGRPGRLVASSLDTRSLMFGMPKHKRHWYLDVLDVSGLVLTEGSTSWSEREWRKRMKELTGQRMATMDDEPASTAQSRSTSRNSKRLSYGNSGAPSRPRVGFADDAGSIRSSRSFTRSRPGARDGSAPPDPNRSQLPPPMVPATQRHSRHISDPQDMQAPYPMDNSPPWQQQQPPMRSQTDRVGNYASDLASTPERVTSEDANPVRGPMTNVDEFRRMDTPEPVHLPPAFAHGAGSRPPQKPVPSPEMRRATIRLSNSTLSQIAGSQGFNPDTFEFGPGPGYGNPAPPYPDQRGLAVQTQTSASALGMNANLSGSREVLIPPSSDPGAARDDAPGTPPPPPRDPARLRTKQSSDQRPPGSAGDDGPPPRTGTWPTRMAQPIPSAESRAHSETKPFD